MIEIDESEQIVHVIRRHWFMLLTQIIGLALLFFLPGILMIALEFLPIPSVLHFTGPSTYVLGWALSTWALIVFTSGYLMWTDYYLDVLIITDKRIFDINQQGLFRRESSAFRIDRIQNVTVSVSGVIPTLLDFGSLHIETAGDNREFDAHYLGNPYEIKKIINEMLDRSLDKSILVHNDKSDSLTPRQETTLT